MFEVTLPAERLVALNEIAEPVEAELPELEEPLELEDEPEVLPDDEPELEDEPET